MGSMSMGMDITSATVTLSGVKKTQHGTIRISFLVRIPSPDPTWAIKDRAFKYPCLYRTRVSTNVKKKFNIFKIQCFASESASNWKVRIRIRISIKVICWIPVRINLQMTSKMYGIWVYLSIWAFFQGFESLFGSWDTDPGWICIKVKVGSGSGYASKWQAGSVFAFGSASKWCGSTTLFFYI